MVIGKNVKTIVSNAFEHCDSLHSVLINSNEITAQSDIYRFFGKNIKEYIIGDNIETIGSNAFYRSGLANIVLGDNIKSVGSEAFSLYSKIYVNRNPILLLKVWNGGGVNTYIKGTDIALPVSKISVEETTQMTATVKVMNYYEDFIYTLNDIPIDGELVTLQSCPERTTNLMLKLSKDGVTYSTKGSYKTKDIRPSVARAGYTASSLTLKSSYIKGDAPVTAQVLSINGVTVEGDSLYLNGLRPGTLYTAIYTITVDNKYTYTGRADLYTDELNFVNVQPKVITEGNVIIASTSNLDYEETNVGFQWRRVDWTDDFESNSAVAYTYEGTMEGYIRNMNTNYLWKFRPYYQSSDGSYSYGKWLGIDPTNTSYFEPTVHTYSQITLNGNTALVKGYVMRGSDDVVSQGFKYWEVFNETSEANEIPINAQTVETTGLVMEVQLTNLAYSTTYRYVAFVLTSEGETYYGDERQFTTGETPTGIEERNIEEGGGAINKTIYDLSGRKISRLQKGINFIRYSNGKTYKVMVK